MPKDWIEIAQKYRIALIPLQDGRWFAGVIEDELYLDCHVGIVDGNLEKCAIASSPSQAVMQVLEQIN